MNVPADPTQVKDIADRIRKANASFGPKNLPANNENRDETNPDFPKARNLPQDPGWRSKDMITGNGHGPELSNIDFA